MENARKAGSVGFLVASFANISLRHCAIFDFIRVFLSMNHCSNIAKWIDVSAVRANSTEDEVRQTLQVAVEYGCLAVFSLPCFTPVLSDLIAEIPRDEYCPVLGGAVGFPGGGELTSMKTAQARELLDYGCSELDMVINVGFMKSGWYAKTRDDIRAVKQTIGSVPLKVILECHYLSDDEIRHAAELAVEAGADWVKTSTGWAPTGATFENVALIKKTVGNSARVKASGGVRDLQTLLKMADLGVERFGIGCRTVVAILEEYMRIRELEQEPHYAG